MVSTKRDTVLPNRNARGHCSGLYLKIFVINTEYFLLAWEKFPSSFPFAGPYGKQGWETMFEVLTKEI